MNKNLPILLITPPFTQLNAPYPATPVIKGFLNLMNYPVYQADLGIELMDFIFSEKGLSAIFEKSNLETIKGTGRKIWTQKNRYIECIEPVKRFLKGNNPTLAYRISNRNYLPEGSRFKNLSEIETQNIQLGTCERAKHLATLYIEDLADFIRQNHHEGFELVRYQSHLAQSAPLFDPIYNSLQKPLHFIDEWLCGFLKKHIEKNQPLVVGFTVPFPGNLFSALVCAQYIRKNYPKIKVVFGGGYISTELRNLSDTRIFEFAHYLIFDDGEVALLKLLEFFAGKATEESLVQAVTLHENTLQRFEKQSTIRNTETGTPDFTGLPLHLYFSLVENVNPMHKLWTDGFWNKLTLAHGCYWAKCAFCDTRLDYINRYDAPTADKIVERMKTIMQQTGHSGFHFTDEAAPPNLLKNLALAILREGLQVTWWGNIRFEKAFTTDLCRLLAESGCIAVTGGIETASDRLLKLMNKGVTIEQAAQVTRNFTQAGIMVHAYLMYGFPSQTIQETIDSLEIVRQFFERKLIHSAFWHRFALTCHSPVSLNPEKFGIKVLSSHKNPFANNELPFSDFITEKQPDFQFGLNKATYNYMHRVGFDIPVHEWFGFKVPKSLIPPKWIAQLLKNRDKTIPVNKQMVWLGGNLDRMESENTIITFLNTPKSSKKLSISLNESIWLQAQFEKTHYSKSDKIKFTDIETDFNKQFNIELVTCSWFNEVCEAGWLFI